MPACAKIRVLLPKYSAGFFPNLAISGLFGPRQKSSSARRKKGPPRYQKPATKEFALKPRPSSNLYLLHEAVECPKMDQRAGTTQIRKDKQGDEVERKRERFRVSGSCREDGTSSGTGFGGDSQRAPGYHTPQMWTSAGANMSSNGNHNGMAFSNFTMQNSFSLFPTVQANNAFNNYQPSFFTPNMGFDMNMLTPIPLTPFNPSAAGFMPGQSVPGLSPNSQHIMNGFASSAQQHPEPHIPHSLQPTTGRPSKERDRLPITAPSAASGGVPDPTDSYLMRASFMPKRRPQPGPLLVVIDLNGTLLHRRKASSAFESRRHAREFVSYCIQTFWVVIWSSAKPENVNRMVSQLLPTDIHRQVVAVWGREKFGLSSADYNKRTQCYKRLTWVWDDQKIKSAFPRERPGFENGCWDQGNTVLIDDSIEKARSEPHNALTLPEYLGGDDEGDDVLPNVHDYLNELCYQEDVSAYIRAHPFKMPNQDDKH